MPNHYMFAVNMSTTTHVNVDDNDTKIVSGSDLLLIRSQAEMIASTLVMTVCIAATVFGNVLVVLSVFTYRPLHGVQNFYIVSLAVADLAVAVLVMPLNVANFILDGRWPFGIVICHVWLTADILTCTASILNLCAIALDRYRAIHDPIGYTQRRTVGRVLATVAVVWATSAIISVPPLIGWNAGGTTGLFDEPTSRCQLTDDRGFVVYSAAGSFYVPLGLMTFVYVKIYLATRRRLRARSENYLRVTTAAAGSGSNTVAGCSARATQDRPHNCAEPPSHLSAATVRERRQRPGLVDGPSIESLSNEDFDVDMQQKTDAACTSHDNANPVPSTRGAGDTAATLTAHIDDERMTSVDATGHDLSPELDLGQSSTDFLSRTNVTDVANDVANVELTVASEPWCSDSSADCQEMNTIRFTTSRTHATIVDSATDCKEVTDLAVSVKQSQEVKEDSAFSGQLSRSNAPKERHWNARRTLTPVIVVDTVQPHGNDRTHDESASCGNHVVGRMMAEKQRQATKKERRVARTMAVIMAAFVVCWLPFFVIYVVFPFCGAACSESVDERLVTFIVWLGYVNSTLNPVIYTVFNVDFRRAFKSILLLRCCRRRRA